MKTIIILMLIISIALIRITFVRIKKSTLLRESEGLYKNATFAMQLASESSSQYNFETAKLMHAEGQKLAARADSLKMESEKINFLP